MFARRDFVHKRSQNGAHLNLAARYSPTLPSLVPGSDVKTPSASPSTSSDPKITDSLTPLTPVVPAPKTTDSSTTSSSSTASSLSILTTSSISSSTSTSSTSTSSSATRTISSTVSTPLTVAPTTATHISPVATQGVTSISFTPTSSLSPSTTSSAGSSSGTNTGAIVGGVAGTLAGIAVLGFLLMWCMRRQRSRDIDDFDAQAFKRQSVIMVDDPVEPPRSYNPRPPTMIERHNASPALAAQGGYSGQNFYGGYGGYGRQPPHAPPEMIQPAGSPPPQAYGTPSMGYAGHNDLPRQVTRQPSNAEYLTRQSSPAAGFAPPTAPPGSLDPSAHYIDLNRSSISPYQATQYADISRQLGTTNPNGQVLHETLELPEGPLPSPFDDPVEATLVPDVTSPHVHLNHPFDAVAPGPVTAIPAQQTQGNATKPLQRPVTLYEEGDAYGGI